MGQRPVVTVGLLTPAEGAVLPWLQETVLYEYHRWVMRMAPGGRPVYRVFPPLGSHQQMVSMGEREWGNWKTHVRAQPGCGTDGSGGLGCYE